MYKNLRNFIIKQNPDNLFTKKNVLFANTEIIITNKFGKIRTLN